MRTWVKYVALVAAGGVFASSAMAADHRDGHDTGNGVKAQPAADINDVYAFFDEDEGGNLVMIGSIGGTDNSEFSDAVQYVFHIGRSSDALGSLLAPAADETLVLCEFASETEASCYVGTPGQEANAVVTGDPSTSMGDATLKVHAGHHKDPFFFFLTGFGNALDYIDTNLTTVLGQRGQDGCPDLTPPSNLQGTNDVPATTSYAVTVLGMLGPVTGIAATPWDETGNTVGSGEVDDFLANNIAGLVVSISPTLIDGTGDFYQVYMTTHKR